MVHILVTGATGLIGSAVTARLLALGHQVTGVARGVGEAARRMPQVRWRAVDIARTRTAAGWAPALAGVDAVVNCAGALQHGGGDDLEGVHTSGIDALYAAAEQAGIRRVIHISAMGVDRATPTAFSRTKLAGEQALMARDLDWVILRPSVVIGPAAYGGSAMFRGLAALPILPVMPDTGPLQVVQLDDVVATVVHVLAPDVPGRVALDLAGPTRHSFAEVVNLHRRWLGFPDARTLPFSRPVAALLYRLGDFAGWLGWRPPLRSTARVEIGRGAVGDPAPWITATGILPTALPDALAAHPASVQERWFAGLYILKPVLFTVFALFWIGTGIVSIGPGYGIGRDLMLLGGAGALAGPSVIAGGLADLLIGIGIAFRRTTRLALYAAIAISVFYAIAGTTILPALWIEPLGPMLKIWPILGLNLVLLAILEDR
ncbi:MULTISPECIES: SDR family oxidoreductase [Tistrella]|uniref:SDR family oxidoreductase n=1 Tax=Tistrella TaxID=171436 RepID=UPI0031F6500C